MTNLTLFFILCTKLADTRDENDMHTEDVKHISDGVKLELNLNFQTGRNGQHSKSSVTVGILTEKNAEFY